MRTPSSLLKKGGDKSLCTLFHVCRKQHITTAAIVSNGFHVLTPCAWLRPLTAILLPTHTDSQSGGHPHVTVVSFVRDFLLQSFINLTTENHSKDQSYGH